MSFWLGTRFVSWQANLNFKQGQTSKTYQIKEWSITKTNILAKSFKFPEDETGILINYLEKNSPAIKGGLQKGDIIVQFNGHNINGVDSLSISLNRAEKGKSTINIFRNGEFKDLEIFLEEQDAGLALNMQGSEKSKKVL